MLTKRETALGFAIVRELIGSGSASLPAETDWALAARIAEMHGLESLVECSENPALQPLARPERRFGHALYRRNQRQTVSLLFREMARRGLRAALLKGPVLEDCYSADALRCSGDIDLFVPGEQREAFNRMMDELHIPLLSDITDGQCGVDVFETPDGVELEVHYIIFRFFTARQRSILRDRGWFSAGALISFTDGELHCETLLPEAHLAYLFYHTAKHMLHHDLSLRMLADLTVYIRRYAGEIDWGDFQALFEELRMRPVTDALLSCCVRHLGLDRAFLPPGAREREGLLRRCLSSLRDYRWEQPAKETHWPFYRSECVPCEGGFASVRSYRPREGWKRHYIKIFLCWRLIRLLWGVEIDKSGETV